MKLKLSLTVIFFISFFAESFICIPSFARKYQMSCQTCHSPFPKLKPYGEEFAGDGFVIKDKETPRAFVETGDRELILLREIPLALRLEGFMTYNNNNSERFDFTSPYLLKLLSGGEISKDISYYFYFFISERGEVAGIEDAFVMFNNLFSSDLDFYVGQFQVSDPLFKRELRLTFEDYKIYKAKPEQSAIDLTYDRGIMLTYGMPWGMDITFEALNGNGIKPADDDYKIFDKDIFKNFALRISQDFIEELRIGCFGYYGKEEMTIGANNFTNKAKMFGADATLKFSDKLEINAQFLYRDDTRGELNWNLRKTKGGFAEAIFTPKGDESKWYVVGLYNYVKSDVDYLNYHTLAAHFGYMLRRNIRGIFEAKRDFERKYNQISVGLILAY